MQTLYKENISEKKTKERKRNKTKTPEELKPLAPITGANVITAQMLAKLT